MTLAVSVDVDWASEAAIGQLLDFLRARDVPATLFTTHHSARVEAALADFEVGLHPNFAPDSSHGATVDGVVRTVLELPHNLPAFRCHRFASSNEIVERLAEAGMRFASNVCADLEVVAPFRDRVGCPQFPIFLEDGGYLYRRRSLVLEAALAEQLAAPGLHVLSVHPMHFAINTPDFEFMRRIKTSTSRSEWGGLSEDRLAELRHRGRGIGDLLVDVLDHVRRRAIPLTTLGAEYRRRFP